MFSIMAALSRPLDPRLDAALQRGVAHLERPERPVLATGWSELDDLLPDRGFSPGVCELAAPHGLGGGTRIALAAVAAAHARSPHAMAAWVDPEGTLYAPGVAQAGVQLERLLVVRPEASAEAVARVVARLASASIFDVLVVDVPREGRGARRAREGEALLRMVRRLAVSAEEHGLASLLLSDSYAARASIWPVSLRLELTRLPAAVSVKVAKERRGRVGTARTLPLREVA